MKTDPAERLEQLRRTIHTLNNALTPIMANAQLIQAIMGPGSEVDQEVADVIEGAQRTKQLIKDLREIAESLVECLEIEDG
jgi:signal transduction histidine kinase